MSATSGAAQPVHLGAGDMLDVIVFESPDLSTRARVGNDGDILLPLTGPLHVAGLSVGEASQAIRQRLMEGKFVKNPVVTVTVTEFATQGVSVLGEVKRPGIYVPMGPHRLDDYLSLAEGITPYASSRIIIMHRDKPEAAINVDHRSTSGPTSGSNPVIDPGDTIQVLKAGEIYVVGDVARPGGFLMDHDEHLTIIQALALAQGANRTAALNHSKIIRKTGEGRTEIPVNVSNVLALKSKDLALQDDDILFVPLSKAKAAISRSLEAITQTAVGTATYRTF